MNIEQFYNYCMGLPGTEESFPFDEKVLVFKVGGKMFALTDVDAFDGINLKCDPVKALELRAEYREITPGYHMNKKHWNTVNPSGALEDELIYSMIKDSYDLVVAGLPQNRKEKLSG